MSSLKDEVTFEVALVDASTARTRVSVVTTKLEAFAAVAAVSRIAALSRQRRDMVGLQWGKKLSKKPRVPFGFVKALTVLIVRDGVSLAWW